MAVIGNLYEECQLNMFNHNIYIYISLDSLDNESYCIALHSLRGYQLLLLLILVSCTKM